MSTLTPDGLVQQGLNALGLGQRPVDHVEQQSPAIQKEVAQKSAIPNDLHLYRDGEYLSEGGVTDGDNPAKDHRLAYNGADNLEDAGKSFDAWETPKAEWWLKDPKNKKKMAKQRTALARVLRKEPEEITNEHVFKMGTLAKERLNNFFQDPTGPNEVTIDGVDKPSEREGDTRIMGAAYLNHKGEDARTHMNTEMWNANYHSKHNMRGRAEQNVGTTRIHGDEVASDYAVKNTTLGYTKNLLQGGTEAIDGVSSKILDVGADAYASTIKGASEVSTEDEALFRSIETKRELATKKAQLHVDRNAKVNAAKDAAIANLYGDDIADTGTSIEEHAANESLEATTDKYLREVLTPEELQMLDGSGKGRRVVQHLVNDAGDSVEIKDTGKGYRANLAAALKVVPDGKRKFLPVSTTDDRYTTLAARRDARANINKVGNTRFDGSEGKVDAVTGKPEKNTKVNPILKEEATQDVASNKEAADKLWDDGKYVQATAEWVKGGTKYITKHPGASFQGAVESVPDMAFYIAAPTLAIATNTHATYEEGKDTFFEERGRLPNKQEQGVLVATSAASAIVEKMGAEVALGKPGKILGNKLKEVLGKRLGLTSSMAATLATSAVIEGGEEVVTELIKQVGVNQGKDKLYDSDKLYQSYVEGMAAGGMTRATLEASNLPKNVVSDILSVASGKTVKAGVDVAGKVINKVAPETVKSESSYKKSLEGGLRGAISRVESGDAGYNAYNRGQAGKTGEAKNIEGMTVGEFMAEQSAYESDKSTGIFAGGKYQIIPETMRLAAKSLGLKPEDKFDAAMQERIFQDYLVKEKRPQMYNYITGKSDDQAAAQKAMGQEWASVAYDEKGVSYYAKDSAGNKAHLSDKDTDALLDTARAEYAKGIKAGLSEQEAYSKAMGAKTAATAFSYPKGSVDKRTGQFKSAGVKVYEQADVKPVTRKVVERAAKATGLTETEVTTPPVRVPESTETAPSSHDFNKQYEDSTKPVEAVTEAPVEYEAIDTQKEAADSIQMLASLPDEMFNSQEGIIELTNHVGSASSALQREIQAISKMAEDGVEIPSARIKAMETMSDQIEHMRQTTVALTKQYADTPIAALDSTGRVGEAITRGSAALADIDTSGLVGDVATMVKELSAFDSLVNQTAAEAPNTFKEVQGEALGTRTNAQGKAGLGQHMSNLGAAVAGSHMENAANSIQAMVNFKRSQETKFDAIETAYKEFQKTGQPQTVKYGPLKESTFVVKDHKTKGILNHIQKEIKVMDKGIKLSVDLATAHFDPASQRKQKTEQHKATMDKQPSVGEKDSKPVKSNVTESVPTNVDAASKYQDMSLSEMKDAGIALNNEIKSLTDTKDVPKKEALIEERNSLRQLFNDKAKTGIPSVPKPKPVNTEITPDTVVEDGSLKSTRIESSKVLQPEANKTPINAKAQGALKRLHTLAYDKKGNPRSKSAAPLGNQHIKALEGILSKEAIESITTPGESRAANLQEIHKALSGLDRSNPTPVIEDSPKVEEIVPAPKPSEVETVESKGKFSTVLDSIFAKREEAPVSETVDSPTLDSIISHSAKVGHIANPKGQGKAAESASSKRILPLKRMLTSRKPVEKVKGIIGKTTDLFTELRQMSEDAFTPDERSTLPAIEQFTTELSEAVDRVLPDVGTKGGIQQRRNSEEMAIFREDANRSPYLQLLNEQGEMSKTVKDAMGIAMLEWVQTSSAATMYQSPSDVYQFFGKDEKMGGLSDAVLDNMSTKGSHITPQALAVGKAILKNLNVKQIKDRSLDGMWETRLAQSLGDLAFVAMSNMTTTPQDGSPSEPRGYIEFNHIDATYLNAVTGNTTNNDNAGAVFVRIPLILGKNGLPTFDPETKKYVTSRSVTQLRELSTFTGFKTALKKIVGTDRREGGVTALPETNIPTHHTGTSTKLSPLLSRYIKKLNAQTMVRNPQWDLMKAFEDHPNEWLRLHGWVEPTVDSEGNATFPELHDSEAISANGKNQGLVREYEQSLAFEDNWEAGLEETRNEINSLGPLLTQALLTGTKEEVKALEKRLSYLEREVKGYENGDIHLAHHAIATGRVNDKGDTLSPQRSKMQRNILSMKDHVETIDITKPSHRFAVIAGLIEPLDLNEKAFAKDGAVDFEKEFSETYMDKEGNASDPVIKAGIEAIQSFQADEQFDHKAIVDAVLKIGEGPHTLSGLFVVASWSNAIKAGESTFTSYGYTEVDGTTNGVIASMRQLVGGFDPSDTNPSSDSKTARIRRIFNSGGVIFKDQDYVEAIDYLQDNPDAYQNIGELSSKALEPIIREVASENISDLQGNVNTIRNTIQDAIDKGRPTVVLNNKELNIADAQIELENAQEKLGVFVFSDTMPDFKLVNGVVAKPIRNMMKAVVMPGGYQAGDAALANSLFNDWVGVTYKTMIKARNESKPELLDPINSTLSKMDIAPVTLDNAQEVFAAADLKKLNRMFNQSLGKIITGAYRDSMGDFNDNAKAINSAFGVMSIIATNVIKSTLAKAERDKGSALTSEEQMDIRKELQAKGVYVGFQQVGATNPSEGISIVKESKAKVSDDRGGRVNSTFESDAVRTNRFSWDGTSLNETKGVKTSSRTSSINEWVPDSEVGVAGMLTSIISIDGMTQALSLERSNQSRVNVYDANITSFLGAIPEAVTTNDVWNNIHEEWSVWDAVGNQLDAILPHKNTKESILELYEFFQPYERTTNADGEVKESGNRFAPTWKDADGNSQPFANLDHFVEWFTEQRKIGDAQRKLVNENVSGVGQHRITGGTAATKHAPDIFKEKVKNITDANDIERGSSDTRIDLSEFDRAMRSEATPEAVSGLFYNYLDNPSIRDAPAHKERLQELMNKLVLPLVRKRPGFGLNVAEGEGITGGAARGNEIYIRTSDKAIRQFSTDMSDAEVLVHEFLHPIIEAGLKDNTVAIQELRELQQQAINSPDFTVESLVDPKDVNQTLAKEKAQRLYDYITGDIHEFAVFGLSNDVVRSKLERIDKAKTEPTGLVEKLLDSVTKLIQQLIGKFTGDTYRGNPSIATGLDNMVQSFDTTTREHLAKKVASTINNKIVSKGRGFLAEQVGQPLAKWGRSASYVVMSKIDNKDPVTVKETVVSLAKTPLRVFDTGFQAAAVHSMKIITDHKQDFFSKLAREAMGPTIEARPYHQMLSQVNEHVDSASLRISAEIKKSVVNAFSRPLSTSEWTMIADTALRGDLKVFRGSMSTEELATLAEDTDALRDRIRATLQGMESSDKRWIAQQASSLGSVMATGLAKIENGNLNAFNIATGVGHSTRKGLSENDTQAINELKSLYALSHMESSQRDSLAAMLRNEPTGMGLVFEVDKVNHEETLIHTYTGDRSREIAGEVMSKSRTRSSTVILPRKDHLYHTSAGFELVKPLGGNLGLYTRTDTPSEGYQKGVFSMGNAEVEGTLIKPADRDTSGNGPVLLPVVQGGRIVAYRAVMDHKTRELDAGMSIGAAESLGNHGGRTHRLAKGNSFNKQIVDIAYGDYLANGRDTKAFIKITTESSNPQVREFARLIPKEMRKDIETQWGGDMYLRKNQLDLMIGFRKMALVDKVNEELVTSGRGEMNAAFSGSVRLAGDVWQGLVGEVKKRTVLFTPAVVIGNFTSNLAVSLLHGMNPVDIVRDQAEGLRAIRAYTKWQDEVAALDLEIKLGKDIETNTRQRKAVQDAMKSSGIHELIEAGMFQTIVEDIDISEGSQGALGLLADKVLPESFSSKAEETYMKAPDSVKTGLGVLMLSPSTPVGANIQAATAYSDFMARYAMFKHLKKKGEPTGKAINEVMDVYVDYAPNTSKEMQYINDMGMYMYTKFLLRIQRVIMRAFRNHPEAVLAMEASQQVLGNTSDIVDSSLLWGVSLSGGRTQTPDEVFDTVSQFPLMHLWSGLKDV